METLSRYDLHNTLSLIGEAPWLQNEAVMLLQTKGIQEAQDSKKPYEPATRSDRPSWIMTPFRIS
jgi:hypothetical protein